MTRMTIKKKFLFFLISFPTLIFSQSVSDIVDFSIDNPLGTARFESMGGAFGALGGDLSAININPAGSAVFNTNQYVLSFSNNEKKINTNFFNSSSSKTSSKFSVNNGGGVWVFENFGGGNIDKISFGINAQTNNSFHNDFHIKGLNNLNSIDHKFPKISVGATQNILMAASLASGKSTLKNCAIEPEVIDLINFLNKCGAFIKVKNRTITVRGVEELKLQDYKVIPDRIEAGSYILATMATKGRIKLNNFNPKDLALPLKLYKGMGLKIKKLSNTSYEIYCKTLKPIKKISTKEFPGYPTDLQAQLIATQLKSGLKSKVVENIFENRFIQIGRAHVWTPVTL